MNFQDRLLRVIPGGAHTYSRGYDQFPSNAPQILDRGKGVHVFDSDGREFLDYGMALRAVNLGYSEKEIDDAAIEQIRKGNNLTRPSMIELEAAELLVNLIDSVDMVKFTKNGSTAVSAAVKLARAYTGRELVARCSDHPFFSYDDWFIGSTPVIRGIPSDTIERTKTFKFNDIKSLEELIAKYPEQLACIVLEPASFECPYIESGQIGCCGEAECKRDYLHSESNYLQQVQKLCHKNGIVFILDEMITGFRWHLKGAQHTYNVRPDLTTFGKAMANGFSVACVAGRREIMELGSIERKGAERVFLLSTTHGAEMSGLGAFVATVKYINSNDVIDYLWKYGANLISVMNESAKNHGISAFFKVIGSSCSPYYVTLDNNSLVSLEFRTLFNQEMIRNGVLMPWISLAHRHTMEDLRKTQSALDASFAIYKQALEEGVDKFLVGPSVKPVFRKFN